MSFVFFAEELNGITPPESPIRSLSSNTLHDVTPPDSPTTRRSYSSNTLNDLAIKLRNVGSSKVPPPPPAPRFQQNMVTSPVGHPYLSRSVVGPTQEQQQPGHVLNLQRQNPLNSQGRQLPRAQPLLTRQVSLGMQDVAQINRSTKKKPEPVLDFLVDDEVPAELLSEAEPIHEAGAEVG